MGSEKIEYLKEMLESKGTEDLQRILQVHSGYSKETILLVRQILGRRGGLSRRTVESQRAANLVSCPDCGKEVSKRAEKCPNCGAPVKKILEWRGLWKSIPKWAWVTFGAIFALLIVIALADSARESRQRSAEVQRQQVLKQQTKEQRKTEPRVNSEQRLEESMVYAKELLDRLVSRGGAISGFWSQRGSAWIEVPANWANNKPICKEYAEMSAKFLSSQLGYMVCVHVYYGDKNEIARACR